MKSNDLLVGLLFTVLCCLVFKRIAFPFDQDKWLDAVVSKEMGSFQDIEREISMHADMLSSLDRESNHLEKLVEEHQFKWGKISDQTLLIQASLELIIPDYEFALKDAAKEYIPVLVDAAQTRASEIEMRRDRCTCVTPDGLVALVHDAQLLLGSPSGGLFDYTRMQGARIVIGKGLTSPTYTPHGQFLSNPFRYALGVPTGTVAPPDTIIDRGTHKDVLNLGNCWAFSGSKGSVTVELAIPVVVTHVTLGKVSNVASTSEQEKATPKMFSVWGGNRSEDLSLMGTFEMLESVSTSHVFQISQDVLRKNRSVSLVTLHIESNYGHPDFTCVHRFRVHSASYLLDEMC